MIATFRPSNFPLCLRIVYASSNACVGCSCAPSPALTTEAFECLAIWCGTPGQACRITMQSGDIASRVLAVSTRVSPFETLLSEPDMLITSAESRLPATSNEVLVRVDASKNRLITVFPRSFSTFFTGPRASSSNDSAESRIARMSSLERSSMPSKSCFCAIVD